MVTLILVFIEYLFPYDVLRYFHYHTINLILKQYNILPN